MLPICPSLLLLGVMQVQIGISTCPWSGFLRCYLRVSGGCMTVSVDGEVLPLLLWQRDEALGKGNGCGGGIIPSSNPPQHPKKAPPTPAAAPSPLKASSGRELTRYSPTGPPGHPLHTQPPAAPPSRRIPSIRLQGRHGYPSDTISPPDLLTSFWTPSAFWLWRHLCRWLRRP